ncbi:MAG: calcium/sodium antiporter [Bdellovibrionales bacterium]|jgi:cation:H+ antiporter|nr:calcium/sodium antiporter [Bdellovibrionales bacterium]
MALDFLYLVLSIVGLYFGAEFALDAAEKIGERFGLPPLLVGVFIIGFGTSLPEFFVSQIACYRGSPDISLGNIVGSNIANIYLILGIAGLLTIIRITERQIKIQLIFHLIITVLLSVFLFTKQVNFISSAILIMFFIIYLFYSYRELKNHKDFLSTTRGKVHVVGTSTYIKLSSGFVLLYFGGELLVSSGTQFGLKLGISKYVLSSVFVAFGTSFPELVTALLACFKKKDVDLIIGNILGSNVFNVAFVLGSIGFYNISFNINFTSEIIMLLVAAILMLLLNLMGKNISKLVGVLFLGTYFFAIYNWVINY